MTKKQRVLNVIELLKKEYPSAICSLNSSNAFELLVAVRLSAQCTDARVNLVTPSLFERYKTLDDYANADVNDIENYIKSCGFYKNKATSIIGMAKMIRDDFDGRVPDNIDVLIKLPGVGRKTANVVASIVYDKPVIAVDTHVSRVSRRLGLSDGKTPEAIGKELEANIDEDKRATAHHWLILQGRYVCTARKPHCEECGLKVWCREYSRNLRKNELKI